MQRIETRTRTLSRGAMRAPPIHLPTYFPPVPLLLCSMQQRSGLRPVRGAHGAVQAAEAPPRLGRHQHHPYPPPSQRKRGMTCRACHHTSVTSHPTQDGMSVRPIFVLLKTNADFLFLLEIGMSGEWKDDNSDRVVEKHAKSCPFTCRGNGCVRRLLYKNATSSPLSLSPFNSNVNAAFVLHVQLPGISTPTSPTSPSLNLDNPVQNTLGIKSKKGAITPRRTTPRSFSLPFSLSRLK